MLDDLVTRAVPSATRNPPLILAFFQRMPKKPIKIEIIQEGDERFLLKEYADGSEERVPIVKLPRKPPRYKYRTVTLDRSRKKGF